MLFRETVYTWLLSAVHSFCPSEATQFCFFMLKCLFARLFYYVFINLLSIKLSNCFSTLLIVPPSEPHDHLPKLLTFMYFKLISMLDISWMPSLQYCKVLRRAPHAVCPPLSGFFNLSLPQSLSFLSELSTFLISSHKPSSLSPGSFIFHFQCVTL